MRTSKDVEGAKILIVDDDPAVLKTMKRSLEAAKFVCETAPDGLEALGKLNAFKPDLILTDYQMPRLSGLGLLKEVQDKNLNVGVIIMTSSVDIMPAIDAVRLGAYEYLLKPMSDETLLLSIERVLIKRNLIVENQLFHSYMETTFRRYVGPEILSVLISARNLQHLDSKKLVASVLFCDIRNFSDLVLTLEVKQLVDLLNEQYFHPIADIITSNKGTVDKFIGDGVMAVFGAPTPDKAFAQNAVRAAEKIVLKLQESLAQGRHPFRIGIGIATGEVVSGNVGSSTRMDFTVMGNAVNVAARLEKLAGPGMILIDEETHARIAGLSEMSDRLEVHLKGQKNAIGVYQVKPKTA